ncbi:hypothetical protein M434DRAFT_375335 [Hypoxylon sp. CO27-5]|nr:hypothetical protein M434DRAFT_375335 [Hypoxylon sp. CO27-5]
MSTDELGPIAIIGSACRFAGGINSPNGLLKLLRKPRDVQALIPKNRFAASGFFHAGGQYHGHTNVKSAYVLDQDPAVFDASFFDIKPVEAQALDPQQRLLLEVVYEGLESAGIALENIRGTDTGVYVGQMSSDYEILQLRDSQSLPNYHTLGTQRAILANRISHFFDWTGPSISIDTTCSSNLIAIHFAAQALRCGEARQAVACGTNLLLGPEHFIGYSKLMMLSPEGKSKMWDEGANGYACGEGVAAIVLKTLRNAIQDGDRIECVLRATGVNQDGCTKSITMPSPQAQAALIQDTYRKAGLDLHKSEDRCQYFEAHGTGTRFGDSVEAEAIQSAFFSPPAQISGAGLPNDMQSPPLYVGSKNVEVPTSTIPWPVMKPGQLVRRASVNSFGVGGTNAHAIVENYPFSTTANDIEHTSGIPASILFSAASEKSLNALLESYKHYLEEHPMINVHDLGATLMNHRSLLRHRAVFTASSTTELRALIEHRLEQAAPFIDAVTSRPSRMLAIFTGQGAQYARMGAELLLKSPFSRKVFDTLDSYLSELSPEETPSWPLTTELLTDGIPQSRRVYGPVFEPIGNCP